MSDLLEVYASMDKLWHHLESYKAKCYQYKNYDSLMCQIDNFMKSYICVLKYTPEPILYWQTLYYDWISSS